MLNISFNPYPTRYRLPGDLTPSRRHLNPVEGRVRECIAHALTFHGIPLGIDDKIDQLPSQEKLEALKPLRRSYLSFTVYSLKQMVAAGTISPDTAWSLFNGEWDRIENVTEDNFIGMRAAFMQEAIKLGDLPEGLSLLELEFYARAGKIGLSQYERYSKWAERLAFDGERLSEPMKEECRKALWLEMRIIEGQFGLSGLNLDVGKFTLLGGGRYRPLFREIWGSVDIFAWEPHVKSGIAIDSTIKAEIGHWMFDLLLPEYSWVSELMDRMNQTGYTANAFRENGPAEILPPEGRTFREGGFYQESGRRGYPAYPEEFPEGMREDEEEHVIAEYVEREVRKRIMRALENNEISREDVYKTYRKMGLYIVLLNLERKSKEEILYKIGSFDLKEIDEYYDLFLEKTISALKKILSDADHRMSDMREKAAKALRWVGASPALKKVLDDKDYIMRKQMEEALRNFRVY